MLQGVQYSSLFWSLCLIGCGDFFLSPGSIWCYGLSTLQCFSVFHHFQRFFSSLWRYLLYHALRNSYHLEAILSLHGIIFSRFYCNFCVFSLPEIPEWHRQRWWVRWGNDFLSSPSFANLHRMMNVMWFDCMHDLTINWIIIVKLEADTNN